MLGLIVSEIKRIGSLVVTVSKVGNGLIGLVVSVINRIVLIVSERERTQKDLIVCCGC